MADKLKKASKAHTRYYLQDGTLVPGATTVTGDRKSTRLNSSHR